MSTLFIVTGDALSNVSMSGHFDLDRTCIDDNPISLAPSLSLSQPLRVLAIFFKIWTIIFSR